MIQYTKQLFDAAIQSSVARSKMMIGVQNLFSVETDIGTFDFEEALRSGFAEKYRLIKLQFEDWLEAWLKKAQPIIPPTSSVGPSRLIYPVLTQAPLPAAIVREVHERLTSEIFTYAKYILCCDVAVLDEDGEFTGKYRSRVFNRLIVKKRTNVLTFDFQAGQKMSVFLDLKFGFMVLDREGNKLSCVGHVQELTQAGDMLRSFRLYLLFENALLPDGTDQPYIVELQYQIDDPFPDLGQKRDSLTLTRGQGDADEMIVAVALPRSKLTRNFSPVDVASIDEAEQRSYNVLLEGAETIVPSETLEVSEIVDKLELTASPDKYAIFGRNLKNAKQGQCFGLAWN